MTEADEVEEPSLKRVRLEEQASTSSGSLDEQVKLPALPAREVVELRFVRDEADVDERGAAGNHSQALRVKPSYLHQIIPDESVHGCRSASVAVYIHVKSLTHWIDSNIDPFPPRTSASEETPPTDVQALLTPFIKGGLVQTRDQFLAALTNPFQVPLSNRVAQYSAGSSSFAVYKEKLFETNENGNLVKREAFHDFHRRMAFFMFVSIDGASFIDDEDPRWEIFVTVQLENDVPSTFIGYATIYPFAVMTRTKRDASSSVSNDSQSAVGLRNVFFVDRIRISQVAILPAFQRNGHGGHLLDAIYEDGHARRAMEITVEDPSKGFRVVRDVTDLQWAYRHDVIPMKKSVSKDCETLTLTALRSKLLFTAVQARRCLEVHQLRFVDREDEEAYKKYRLWVKRRLMKDNFEEMNQFEPDERKEKLAQLYEDYESEYLVAVRRIEASVNSTNERSGSPPSVSKKDNEVEV